jgi:hypothetical protein
MWAPTYYCHAHAHTQAEPSLWPAAVEELCRYHTASGYALRRVALEDVEVEGKVSQHARCPAAALCLSCVTIIYMWPPRSYNQMVASCRPAACWMGPLQALLAAGRAVMHARERRPSIKSCTEAAASLHPL